MGIGNRRTTKFKSTINRIVVEKELANKALNK